MSKKKNSECCNNFNPCTALTALLILCKSGLLCNDRAFILILLFWLCGGANRTCC
ncbi:hypothetical protein SAMN02745163_00874 [Clostridium cavendishii DSM 21758]|uniref:Uncharacterized protein n=1 Tax=Clostridium cavendishii DSM 21758 TaxID=1121302 RepID=A0A1M6EKB0_9CLOT|nr:hypothetical protein [Clostridium cavendishii]SHI85952.1 hypothetical protein SAMN02745163_00874 [Clostridium cavendishii DSM 21758]